MFGQVPSKAIQFRGLAGENLTPWGVIAAHEAGLAEAPRVRRQRGAYYTPRAVCHGLIADTVGAALAGDEVASDEITVFDPACGAGALLVAAYEAIAARRLRDCIAASRFDQLEQAGDRWRLSRKVRAHILESQIFGCDVDATAAMAARRALALAAFGNQHRSAPDLTTTIRTGDAVLDHHPPPRLFTVVVGNPPWGQKRIAATPEIKRAIRERYPSVRGIFDWFRPFVELGIRLTRAGGHFGMVLPDIVLLKNYEPTRRLILDELSLTRIAWLGPAFADAAIDTVTVAGHRARSSQNHEVEIFVAGDPPLSHAIPQADFHRNERCTLNLHMTAPRRRIVDQIAPLPRLGDVCGIHEGVHSGNIRGELFVANKIDDSCVPLYRGRGEIQRFGLDWKGAYLRLSAMPTRRTRDRYANLGQRAWHEREKILVRRTGDRILAAVDVHSRYASNNFFLVSPRREISLDALCAILNSEFATWLFRVIEPRVGRPFSELKIKHLSWLPVPHLDDEQTWRALAKLGAQRRMRPSAPEGAAIDRRIDALIAAAFGVSSPLP